MEHYLWTSESWGSGCPPENYEEIISAANELIEAYAETHDEDDTVEYSAWLWDCYCTRGELQA